MGGEPPHSFLAQVYACQFESPGLEEENLALSRRKKLPLVVCQAMLVVGLVSGCRTDGDGALSTEEGSAEPSATETAEPDEEPVTIEVTRLVIETRVVEIAVTPEPEPEEPEPKELIICLTREPESLYPYAKAHLPIESEHVLHAIYEPLFTSRSYDYQPVALEKLPSIADGDAFTQTVTVQADDRVMDVEGDVVFLRPGVTVRSADGQEVAFNDQPLEMEQLVVRFTLKPLVWSDGRPVTADDSVYSFELAGAPGTPIPKQDIERTASYQATGDLTLEWVGVPGYRDHAYFTKVWMPYPRHYWGEIAATDLPSAPESGARSLSHGPYKLVEWVPGNHISLARNPHYYRLQEGLPHFDTVRFDFVDNNSQLQVGLLSGQCDIGTHEGFGVRDLSFMLDAEAGGQLATHFGSGTIFEHIDFGINPAESYESERPDWFEDVRLRQAFMLCTDRQRIIDEVLLGKAELTQAYVPPSHPLYPAGAATWPHDIEAGNALLDQLRFLDADEDGFRNDPRFGGTLKVTLLSALGNSVAEQVATIFKESLAECGIQIDLSFVDSNQYFADGPEGPLFGRRFDLALFPWLIGVEPNCALYMSSRIPGPENGWDLTFNNQTGFSDETFDAACRKALGSLPGLPEYDEAHRQAIRIWIDKSPVIPLFMRPKLAATRPEIENFELDPTQPSELWNLAELDLAD